MADTLSFFNKLKDAFDKNQASLQKVNKSLIESDKIMDKVVKDALKLTDAYKKNEISTTKFTKEFDKLNKSLKTNKVDMDDIIKRTEALNKALKDGTITATQAAAEFKSLSKTCADGAAATDKISSAFGKFKGAIGGVKSIMAGFGLGLSFDKIAESAANFGKTIFKLKQSAAATGQDFGKFKESITSLSKETGLSEQHVAEFFLTFQKGIKGTLPTVGAMSRIIKSMNDMSLSVEDLKHNQESLIEIQNAAPQAIDKLNSEFKDKAAIDNYAQSLVQQGLISQVAAENFSNLADTMRAGKSAADDEPTTKLAEAMKLLSEKAQEAEKVLGERLAPILTKVANVLSSVMEWVAKAPDWAIWSAAGVAAALAIAAVVAPLVIAVGGIASAVAAIGAPLAIAGVAIAGIAAYFLGTSVAAKLATSETEKMAKAAADAKKALTGQTGPGAGSANEALSAEQKRQKTIDEQSRALTQQIQDLERIRKKDEAIIDAEESRYNNLLKYNNDIPGAVKSNEAIRTALEEQLMAQKAILATAQAMLEIDPKSEGALQKRAEATSAIVGLEAKINDNAEKGVNIFSEQKSQAEARLQLAESELNLSQQLYLGIGPTLDAQKNVLNALEDQLGILEKQMAIAQQQIAEGKNVYQNQKLLAQLQGQKNGLVAKELQMTKNLREGYLDAMGAFTNVEGAFSKVILRREQGMGAILRQFGGPGGAKAGLLGNGLDNPMARREAGTGQLQYNQGSADQLYKLAGYDNPLNRTHIGGAAAAQGAGAEDAAAAASLMGKGGVTTGSTGGGSVGGGAATGEGSLNVLVNTANDQMSAVQKLNEDMPKNVAEGIKMAGGLSQPSQSEKRIVEQEKKNVEEEKKNKKIEKEVVNEQKAAAQAQKEATGAQVPQAVTGGDAEMRQKEQKVVSDVAAIQKQIEDNPIGGRNVTNVGIGRRGAGGAAGGTKAAQAKYFDRERRHQAEADQKMAANGQRAALENAWKGFGITDAQGKKLTRAEDIEKARASGQLYQKDDKGNVKSANDLKTQIDQRKAQYDQMKYLEKVAKNTEQTNKILDKQKDKQDEVMNTAMSSVGADSGGVIRSGGNTGHVLEGLAASMFGMAGGGLVPGSGSGDTVPAMLTPGERVMRKDVSRKLGPFLDALNKNHYAVGGVVGSSPALSAMVGGGGTPNISLSVHGDSVTKILKSVNTQLSSQLNRMMVPYGQTGRAYEQSQ